MAISMRKAMRNMRERERRERERCSACTYCAPDHKRFGPGWIEQDNNGPIVSCPVCNPNGTYQRRR